MTIYRENPLRSPGGGVRSPGGLSPGVRSPGGVSNFVGGGGNVFGESPGSKRPLMAEKDGIYDICVDYLYMHIYVYMYAYISTFICLYKYIFICMYNHICIYNRIV